MAAGPPRMGWSIDWTADGRMLTTGESITRHEHDGTTTTVSEQGANEIVTDPHGHVYIDGFDGDFASAFTEPGWVAVVDAEGSTRRVAEDIWFPNGMVITPDGSTLVVAESVGGRLSAFDIQRDGSLTGRRVWADGLGPDGICIDADGGIWSQTADTFGHTGDPGSPAGAVVRVLDGGEVTHRIETEAACFACTLGGPEGRHLFLLCNEFEGVDRMQEILARRSARVLVAELPATT